MASSHETAQIAIVGGDSLLARELRDLLGRNKPTPQIELISAAPEGISMLSAELNPASEEALLLSPLGKGSFEGTSVAFLAGTAASSRRSQKLATAETRFIDLTAGLEQLPDARLRAPSAEPPGSVTARPGVQVIAHPAAIALTMLLSKIHQRFPVVRSIANVLEPASERGQQGVQELQKQTVAVLSFQKIEGDVFDTQLAFNLLAGYGEEALEPLGDIEERMERHLASLLAAWPGVPMPSVRMIQAPVFHGHSISVWVEFGERPAVEALQAAMTDAGFDVRTEDPPDNSGLAGQSGLSVGAITSDRNHPNACWIWLVADNIRLAAENALAVQAELG